MVSFIPNNIYRSIVFTVLIIVISCSNLFSQLNPLVIHQMNYMEPYNEEASTTANIAMQVAPVNNLQFVNVFVMLPSQTEYKWVVQNVVTPPFPNNEFMLYWFDLSPLGINQGDEIEYLLVHVTGNQYYEDFPDDIPLSAFQPVEAIQRPYITGTDGLFHSDPVNIAPFETQPLTFLPIDITAILDSLAKYMVYRGCTIPNVDLDSASNPPGSVEGYAGDKNACGPAGAANSMQWLENVHDEINTGTNLREKLVELSSMMNRQNNSGVSTEDFIKGKLAFIDKHKLPIKVKFQSSYTDRKKNIKSPNTKYGHEAANQNANKDSDSKSVLSWDWLYKEMGDGEDVEIGMDFYEWDGTKWVHKGGHIATVTGVSQIKGVNRIWLKDDADQAKAGGTEQNALTWRTIGESGLPILDEWSKGNKACVVTDLISESYDASIRHDVIDIELGQLDLMSPYSLPNSSSGMFSGLFLPNTDFFFINIVARLDEDSDPYWVVRNMIIPPFDTVRRNAATFDLRQLGISESDSIDKIQIAIFNTLDLWQDGLKTFNPEYWIDYNINSLPVEIGSFDSFDDSTLTVNYLEPISFINIPVNTRPIRVAYRGCEIPNIDLDSSRHRPDGDYTGDMFKCAPAACANSLQWLENTHDEIGASVSHREKLKEIDKLWKENLNDDGSNPGEAFVKAKLAFIDKYRLPIHVKFQGPEFDGETDIDSPDTTNGSGFGHQGENKNESANAYPTWDWLVSEMEAGEDVELAYGYFDSNGVRRGGHMVAVSGVLELGSIKYIWIKDDMRQGGAGLGRTSDGRDSTGEEQCYWGTDDMGRPILRRGGGYTKRIEFVVSESYDSNIQYTVDESSIEMNRINFVEPFSESASTSAICSFALMQTDNFSYLSIVGRLNESSNQAFIVENMPVFPFPRRHQMSSGFNLTDLGMNKNDQVDELEYSIIVHDLPLETLPNLPSSIFKKIDLGYIDYIVGNGYIEDVQGEQPGGTVTKAIAKKDSLPKDTVYRGCNVSNVDLDSAAHNPDNTPGYAGDKNACAPASAANSIHWLEKVHSEISTATKDDKDGTSLREKLEELSKLMKRANNGGVGSRKFIEGKLAFIDKYKLPIHVKFQSKWYKKDEHINSPDTTAGKGYGHKAENKNSKDNAWPTWDFLVSEMKKGEDVEILYGTYDSLGNRVGGHAAVVTGVAKAGNVRSVWIKDDLNQRGPGFGRVREGIRDSVGEERIVFDTTSTGIPILRRFNDTKKTRRIESIVSESYDKDIQFKINEQSIKLNQNNEVDPKGASKSKHGSFSAIVLPSEEMQYINLMARTDAQTPPVWLVKNLPLAPFPNARRISYGVDFGELGFSDDIEVGTIEYDVDISNDYWTQAVNLESFKPIDVGVMAINIGTGSIDINRPNLTVGSLPVIEYIPNLPPIDFVYYGCTIPNEDLDSSRYNPTTVPGYAGDKNACGPVAAANSLQWLENVHGNISTGTTHRKKLEELSKMMNRENNSGVFTKDFIEAKLKFIQKYKLPIEVKFQSFRFDKDSVLKATDSAGNELKARNKNVSDRAYPTWEFFVKELKDSEDVEIEYGVYNSSGVRTGGHWVTATGAVSLGGRRGIWIKDDLRQDTSGLGRVTNERDSVGEEFILWDTTSTGIPILRRWGETSRRIESVVSESPVDTVKKKAIKVLKVNKTSMKKPVDNPSAKSGNVLYEEQGHTGSNPLYGNIMAREPGNDKNYWLVRNAVLTPKSSKDTVRYWFNYDDLELNVSELLALDQIEIAQYSGSDPWVSIPEIDANDWEAISIEGDSYYVASGLADAAASIDWEKPADPVFNDNVNPLYFFRNINDLVIELNASDDDGVFDQNYKGDEYANTPAASATSLHYIDRVTPDLTIDTELRQTHELLSAFFGREEGKGVSTRNMISGMLSFIDDRKVPVAVKYISSQIVEDTIHSPNTVYNHYALKMDGTNEGFPTWDVLKSLTRNNAGIELCLQWINSSGDLIGSHVVSVAGIAEANGTNNLWVVDDTRQDVEGGKSKHHLTWIANSSAQPMIYEWAMGDTLCFVTGIISQLYDKNVKFDGTSVEEIDNRMPNVSIYRNPSDKGETVNIIVEIDEAGMLELEIVDMSGRKVGTLTDSQYNRGTYKFEWDGKDSNGKVASSGNYLVNIKFNDRSITKTIIKW